MTPKRFMLIAGESSGDVLAAELVKELRAGLMRRFTYSPNVQPLEADLAPRFFGAGGPRMAEAGVELAFDMTQHSLIGIPGPRDCIKFLRILNSLFALALEQEPHAIICVDFNLFNALFAAKIKRHLRARHGTFCNWRPKIIKYISPQIWASREARVHDIARDYDLLLSIFPFEKEWYRTRVPKFPVEFIGHPMLDRYQHLRLHARSADDAAKDATVVLLPGSRKGELKRHLPIVLGAYEILRGQIPGLRARMVLPTQDIIELAKAETMPAGVEVRVGGLPEALAGADLAITKTGTITMECASFGVPAVTFYKPTWIQYQVGKRIIKIRTATMPNILAGEEVYPEYIERIPTPQNIAAAALELLRDTARRKKIQTQLANIITSLGGPGASRRAADAILRIL